MEGFLRNFFVFLTAKGGRLKIVILSRGLIEVYPLIYIVHQSSASPNHLFAIIVSRKHHIVEGGM